MSHTMTSNTSSIKKSAQTVLAPIAEDLKAVNDILAREFAHSQSPTITEIGSYITQAGGKRMRPALLMLMAKSFRVQRQRSSRTRCDHRNASYGYVDA